MSASSTLDDPRIAAGMAAQLAARKKRIAAGEESIGWKVGFGTPAAREKLNIGRPLAGFLTRTGVVKSGATVSLNGWTRPVAEPEVAVFIGKDLPGDADEATAAAAISALAPAIELADLHPPPDDVEAILAGNIYHRHVIVGPADQSRRGGSVSGLSTRVVRNGEVAASQADIEANTGRLITLIRDVADLLHRCGEQLRAGEFVIAGSVTPPCFLEANDREFVHEVRGLGSVSVRFAHNDRD